MGIEIREEADDDDESDEGDELMDDDDRRMIGTALQGTDTPSTSSGSDICTNSRRDGTQQLKQYDKNFLVFCHYHSLIIFAHPVCVSPWFSFILILQPLCTLANSGEKHSWHLPFTHGRRARLINISANCGTRRGTRDCIFCGHRNSYGFYSYLHS